MLLFAIVIAIIALPQLVFAPTEILLNTGGDAFKNYYTYLFHTQYGKGIWFEGMNYPYGEHLFFTDAQPLFAIPLTWLKGIIPPLLIFHWVIVAGFILCMIYLHKILKLFSLPLFWSLVFAGLITVMSPQILKLTGHYSLAYLCVIPIIFYYHLCYHQTLQRKYIIYLLICATFFALLHIYFAAIVCFWMGAYSVAIILFKKEQFSKKLKELYPLWVVAFTPMLILKTILWLTDNVIDRPSYPYGARHNRTYLEDIYSSHLSPIWQWLQNNSIVDRLSNGAEGATYIGLAAIIILIVGAIVSIVHYKQLNLKNNNSLLVWVFIAVCLLVFATSIVFIKCFTCLDYAYAIKQFRAVGRFAWGYYYIFSVAAVVQLHKAYKSISNRYIGNIVVSLVLTIWLTEAIPYISWSRNLGKQAISNYNNYLSENNWDAFLNQHNYKSEDFQAILILPYVHIGTEKIAPNAGQSGFLTQAFTASLQTGLPIVDVMMSRSGWQQAFGQSRISGGIYADKPLLKEANDKPILLMHHNDIELTPDEQHLLNAASPIGSLNNNKVYAFYPKRLIKIEQQESNRIKTIASKMTTQDSCIVGTGTWFVQHFDNGNAKEKLFGNGADKMIDGIKEIVFSKHITPEYDGQLYEFSAWTLIPKDNYKIGRFKVVCYNGDDEIIAIHNCLVQEMADNKGLWIRANIFFKLTSDCKKIEVEIRNVIYPAYEALDELMIRPADATIISKDFNGNIMINNHLLK